jgi:hypothetical protein
MSRPSIAFSLGQYATRVDFVEESRVELVARWLRPFFGIVLDVTYVSSHPGA